MLQRGMNGAAYFPHFSICAASLGMSSPGFNAVPECRPGFHRGVSP
jgi:hypothetical protein